MLSLFRPSAQSSVSSSTPTSPNFGEIRGDETFDLLQIVNTGHSNTISTVHANSAAQGLSRFATCVLQSHVEIPYKTHSEATPCEPALTNMYKSRCRVAAPEKGPA